ncbi:MAG: Trp biosynthesis-associated membrane protein [Nocardioides sp.]
MRDRSFGRTVLAGLGGAALASVSAGRDWAVATGANAGVRVHASVAGSDAAPLVLALALVTLAAWGVVLVLRGRARQVVAVVGLAAAVGSLVALIDAFDAAQDAAVAALLARGGAGDAVVTSLTGWYWASGVGALLTALALVVAVRRARTWPALGSRYDAPGARAAAPASDQDMWRALDQGHDPTAEDDASRP